MKTIVKVKPMPTGFWFQNSKWDILRVMRGTNDYIAVVEVDGVQTLMKREELKGCEVTIKNEPFKVSDDGIQITKVVPETEDVTS